MVYFDIPQKISDLEKIEEIKGKLKFSGVDKKLMHSVIENDKETIKEGKLISDAVNQGIGAFTPDLIFEQLVKNYKIAEQIFGKSIIKALTGYDPRYIEKNIGIPEFQKIIKEKIKDRVKELKENRLIDKEGIIKHKGIELASLILYTEELDNVIPKGILGEKIHKKSSVYGGKGEIKEYRKGDRYRDILIKKSMKTAIRRSHSKLKKEDLKSSERIAKGEVSIIYAIDASASMKGKKIEMAKKAGIALAYKAIDENDKVGLLVFGSDIKEEVSPTNDFSELLLKITKARASKQTNIALTIKKAIELFPVKRITKHLILLTDAVQTIGTKKEIFEAVSQARSAGITISLVGIKLKEGKETAEKITRLGEGRLYIVKNLEELDKIILEDYYSVL